MNGPAIRTENLARTFGPVRALDGLSLEVAPGTIFGFLGPNGAGKTTTIRLLLGLLEPTAGHAEVLGLDTRTQADAVRARTGALLDHTGIYEQLSAEDNLDFYGRIWQMPAAVRHTRVREVLTVMGLWERRQDRAGTWSRGMQQKLALARTLLHRPALVLLDEPTAGLDVQAAAAVREALSALVAQEGVTIFLTTHNMAEVETLCQQVVVIRQGRPVAHGRPQDLRAQAGRPQLEVVGCGWNEEALRRLRERPEVAAVRGDDGRLTVDLQGDPDPAALVALLVRAGAQVQEVRRASASMEQALLQLIAEERP